MYKNKFYEEYKWDIYSQNGEDGVLHEILKRLEIKGGTVCEFGAWDGKLYSNTFLLVRQGFKAVYIEGDPERYQDLLKTAQEYPTIIPVNAMVCHNKDDSSLDTILAGCGMNLSEDLDVLSIDIDSYDYQVWKSLTLFTPKIVIIEINSEIHPCNVKHIHEPGKYQGTSFLPMFLLGLQKGYTFALHTGNMIFIRNDLWEKVGIQYDNFLENFRDKWLPQDFLVRDR